MNELKAGAAFQQSNKADANRYGATILLSPCDFAQFFLEAGVAVRTAYLAVRLHKRKGGD